MDASVLCLLVCSCSVPRDLLLSVTAFPCHPLYILLNTQLSFFPYFRALKGKMMNGEIEVSLSPGEDNWQVNEAKLEGGEGFKCFQTFRVYFSTVEISILQYCPFV